VLDSKQPCIPSIDRPHNPAYPANIPSSICCTHTLPPTNHVSLSNPQTSCLISMSPEITDLATPLHPKPLFYYQLQTTSTNALLKPKRLLEDLHKQICEYLHSSTINSNTNKNSPRTILPIDLQHLQSSRIPSMETLYDLTSTLPPITYMHMLPAISTSTSTLRRIFPSFVPISTKQCTGAHTLPNHIITLFILLQPTAHTRSYHLNTSLQSYLQHTFQYSKDLLKLA